MSERNGDKARFQKNRKRKLHQRQRVRALMVGLRKATAENPSGSVDGGVTTTVAGTGHAASAARRPN